MDPRPQRKLAVLTCMDTRLDVYRILGLERGDAHIIRNAGGLVTDDALRSLTISQRLLGTEEIVVMMHEGCGLQAPSEEELAERLSLGDDASAFAQGAFDDLENALRLGVARLRSAPTLIARDSVRGLVFDPSTDELREVDPPPAD
jgi:carbonic anhydrase